MGTQGLRQYLESHGLVRSVERNRGRGAIMKPHHLLFDMNALVHCVVVGNTFTSRTVIRKVVQTVKGIIADFPPRETLVFAFDGVAPAAKLRVQKERRASMRRVESGDAPTSSSDLRYNYDYVGEEIHLAREDIFTGSEFLLACEDELRHAFNIGVADGIVEVAGAGYTTILSGCCEAGEGELKIACALRSTWIKQDESGTYTGKDCIVVVGNDSDLALVGIACVPYSDYNMVNPMDYSLTGVGELFEHWRSAGSNCQLRPELLPSYRIDFVFLMLLAGGDWFEGVRKGSVLLWRNYRNLRLEGGFFKRALISGEDFKVDLELLRAVVAVKDMNNRSRLLSKAKRQTIRETSLSGEEVSHGVELLRGAVWALKSIMGGRCFDYGLRLETQSPTLGKLKAAANSRGLLNRLQTEPRSPHPCFSPLEQYLAVLGTRGRYSACIREALESECKDHGQGLTGSLSITFLLREVPRIMAAVDTNRLTVAERDLREVKHMPLCDFLDSKEKRTTFMSFCMPPRSCQV